MDFNIDYEHATENIFANEVEIEEAVPANNTCSVKCNVNILTENACPEKKHCEKKHKKRCCKKCEKVKCKDKDKECKDCLKVINPCGHAVLAKHTHIHTEKDSISNLSPLTNRHWSISQPNSNLRMMNGTPENEPIHRGYSLMPAFNGATEAQYWSWLTTHLGFSKANFFVSKYDPEEQYGSGKFPILQPNGVGIYERIQANNKNIEGQDVVAWYTMAFNHSCHTEDFPFITLAPQRFTLVPHMFFEWNPATTIIPFGQPNSSSGLLTCDQLAAASIIPFPLPHTL
jgi:hypothetical protein